MTMDEARNVGLRSVNLMSAFNLRWCIKKEFDASSERYGSTPVDGPSKGTGIKSHWEEMVNNYYHLMGWDIETGKPLKETLKSLGIEYVIKDIW